MIRMAAMASVIALAAVSMAQEQSAKTSLDDQTDVAVTVYNSGIALVRDTRAVQLPTGEFTLEFGGVAEQIKPETVSLRSRKQANSLAVYEQNYEYDLINPQKLMEKFVGREIRLITRNDEFQSETVTAKLLSTNNGPVYEIDGQIFLGHPGTPVLPEIPDNLIARPSLVWTLDNTLGAQELEATYLTDGISWKADYVINIPRSEESMNLAGWVTLDNRSGATYTNAQLKLVAGDLNRVAPQPMPAMEMAVADVAMRAAAAPMAKQEAFADFHLYTIPRRTTIKQAQSKQVGLLQGNAIAFEKVYELRSQQWWYYREMRDRMEDLHPDVKLEFENEEANNLGMPLPGGIMRIYQEDSSGTPQFAGEDRIQHTPKDETVSLRMGSAFDLVAERAQILYV